jgi:hypothetical protein
MSQFEGGVLSFATLQSSKHFFAIFSFPMPPVAAGLEPSTLGRRDECSTHRDKTRVQMLAKMYPQLKLLCLLFMAPLLVLTQSKETVFDQIWWFFLQ